MPLSPAVSGSGSAADPWSLAELARPVTLARSADSLVSVAVPGGTVSIGAAGLRLGRPVRAGHTLTFADAATATDLQLVASPAGVKTNLVLRSASRVGTGSNTATYTYDKSGNRLSDKWGSDPANTYAYNAGNQVTSGGHTYDAAGNQTDGGALTAAAYNGYDQAVSVTPTGGAATGLTAAGTTNTELVTQGATTLRNGLPGVQALTTSSGTSYVQRDPKGGLLAVVTGAGATGEYYYVLDGQSNVIGLVDAAGTERARYTYDPYGAHDTAVAVNGALPDNPYRYASGRAVALNASNQVVLYQFGQRFYQRSIGRWTQQDNLEMLGDPAQGNRYTYVGGDPVNSIDPTGNFPWADAIDIAMIVVGAAVLIATAPAVLTTAGAVGAFLFVVGAARFTYDKIQEGPETGGTFCDEYGYCETYS